jgi:hypothetical protein
MGTTTTFATPRAIAEAMRRQSVAKESVDQLDLQVSPQDFGCTSDLLESSGAALADQDNPCRRHWRPSTCCLVPTQQCLKTITWQPTRKTGAFCYSIR